MLLLLSLAFATDDVLHPVRTEHPVGRTERVIAEARTHLGEPYRWEGRGTRRLPGYDCLGILFRAYGRIDGRGWWTYEVNPSELTAGGKLGAPVEGLDGVLREELDASKLMKGDVLYFLLGNYEIPDAPLLVRDGTEYWPWHTGMYLGDGTVLHAEPGGEVREQALEEMRFHALFVTRP